MFLCVLHFQSTVSGLLCLVVFYILVRGLCYCDCDFDMRLFFMDTARPCATPRCLISYGVWVSEAEVSIRTYESQREKYVYSQIAVIYSIDFIFNSLPLVWLFFLFS